jgi:hypothetical protein
MQLNAVCSDPLLCVRYSPRECYIRRHRSNWGWQLEFNCLPPRYTDNNEQLGNTLVPNQDRMRNTDDSDFCLLTWT